MSRFEEDFRRFDFLFIFFSFLYFSDFFLTAIALHSGLAEMNHFVREVLASGGLILYFLLKFAFLVWLYFSVNIICRGFFLFRAVAYLLLVSFYAGLDAYSSIMLIG